MTGHSVLAPSSMARIAQCPGSVSMQAAYPADGSSQAALDGEASHWAAAEMLAGRLVDVGQVAPNGVVLTREMVEGADLYYDDVALTLRALGRTPADGAIERPVPIPRIHAECFGTPDYAIQIGDTVYVWDYKFGHRVVEVVRNLQLVAYALGLVGSADDHGIDVVCRIVQPRAPHRDGPVREWRFPAADLRGFENILVRAAAEALGPAPATRAGPECRDCSARHACPTLQAAAFDAVAHAGDSIPADVSPQALGTELRVLRRAAEMLRARLDGLEQQALSIIQAGKHVPGWAVVRGAGRRKWAVPDAVVIDMAAMLGVSVAKPVEALTPAQAVRAGLPEALVDGVSQRVPGAVSLDVDDGSKARSIFGRGAP